jgi:DNA polymerase III sliding clamp (beta) subunit (PCNA family)
MDDSYPDIPNIFNVRGKKIKFPAELKEIIERAGVLSTTEFEHDRVIELRLRENKIVCHGEGKEGWIEESTKVDYSGKDIDLQVHPVFLQEILNHTQTVKVGDDKMLFQGKNFKHVMALI